MPVNLPADIKGLTDEEVLLSREKSGSNTRAVSGKEGPWRLLLNLFKEPMVVLLFAASALYLVSGETGDAIFLASAIVLVSAISLYQDTRSRNALEKLEAYTQPSSRVVRNGQLIEIPADQLVVGDYLVAEEGTLVAADGLIRYAHDFTVNESILTGESLPVAKDTTQPAVFQGTTVVSGLAIAEVTAIGARTELGRIGESLQNIREEKTPLETQVGSFVRKMVILGAIVFALVWAVHFVRSGQLLDSLLKALTLAMSILPEEIPVAFTSFMALGAWRLMRMGIVVRQMKTVETLGSASIICTDKTGTLTENRMQLARLYTPAKGQIVTLDQAGADESGLIRTAMWASEPLPFDPMEIALHRAYGERTQADERPDWKLVHEYPLGGRPPMMTHVFQRSDGQRIIAAKGAPEAMLAVSDLSETEKKEVLAALQKMSAEGFRVLGVGVSTFSGDAYPERQQDLPFRFLGLVGFYDPPKANIPDVLHAFYDAGISVKIITGDNALTTRAIARQVGFRGWEHGLSGDELMQLSDNELKEKALTTSVFTRMFPDAKLRVVNALKASQQVVAMTGDGVNDGPALKAAHIGIAMGKKGTEIARQAASLILLEDDLARMVDAVAMGRRIYTNLKKAIRYIISIHIPIILTVSLPLFLGWKFPDIFSPVHIIFLELIMGPTCSIVYENEPLERNAMQEPPRPFSETFFRGNELILSIIQGILISVATLGAYQYGLIHDFGEAETRTLVFIVLIAANVFLTLVNRSFYYSFLTTLGYKNRLVPLVLGITILLTILLLTVPPLARFFGFILPDVSLAAGGIAAGFVSVVWLEGWKAFRRLRG